VVGSLAVRCIGMTDDNSCSSFGRGGYERVAEICRAGTMPTPPALTIWMILVVVMGRM
jgi:hypothetical protein